MNSFILISSREQETRDYLTQFYHDHAIDALDQIIITQEDLATGKQGSIGIEIVRKLQEVVFLRPYKSKEKVIVIKDAQQLTVEAQNALLKLLEEPPIYLSIFLCADSEEAFLPTVISRCKIITLTKAPSDIQNFSPENEEQLQTILHGNVGERLVLAEHLAGDKEQLTTWFQIMTHALRDRLLANIDNEEDRLLYTSLLERVQEAYKTFSTTNVNPRAILEHMMLQRIDTNKTQNIKPKNKPSI